MFENTPWWELHQTVPGTNITVYHYTDDRGPQNAIYPIVLEVNRDSGFAKIYTINQRENVLETRFPIPNSAEVLRVKFDSFLKDAIPFVDGY